MRTPAIVTLTLVLLTPGCAGRQDQARDADATEADSIVIVAVNENYYDARVHAVYDGGPQMTLGTIAGNGGTVQAAVPWDPRALIFEISFIISGRDYVSEPVTVTRGEHLELRLPANIDMSGFFRRAPRR